MEYEEFNKIIVKKETVLESVIHLLREKPVMISYFRKAIRKHVSPSNVESFIEGYKAEKIIEIKLEGSGSYPYVGLTKEYREKLNKK